jgi:ABC-type multidrug transport system fused ATPase/permease subunit
MNLLFFFSIFIPIILIGIFLCFFIYGIIDTFRRKEWGVGKRILWFLVIVFFSPLGLLIYFFVNNRKKWGWFLIGFYLILIILFIILAIVFIPFLLQKELQKEREKVKEEYESKIEEKITAWKVYRSESYSFEIEYPENWQVEESPSRIEFYAQKNPELEILKFL